jgi:hypothetical protein
MVTRRLCVGPLLARLASNPEQHMGSSIKLNAMIVATVAAITVVTSASAADYFLTIGGGYDVTGNQLSLERNVVFQQAVLAEQRPDRPKHEIYFADGNDDHRELQYRDPEFKDSCPPARRIMAELFSDEDSIDLVYRNNEIANLTGPAELSLVKRRMREISRELKSGDRLIIYVTGHGGAAQRDYDDSYDYEYDEENQSWKANAKENAAERDYNRYDTSFYVWNSDSVTASEFAGWLDRLPEEVSVVLVMVQCYAGGFAHTIFQQADADLGLSSHARCGFFAQVHDRGAAGCTPDANEADYEEYSSYFWGALGGKTRTGEPISTADYNDDGRVSFAEAHTYAVIESDTIDVPVRTSDALLRKYSSVRKQSKDQDKDSDNNPFGRLLDAFGSDRAKDGSNELVEIKGPLAKLAELARPEQRAILQQLPSKFGLDENPQVEDIEQKLSQVESKVSVANAKLGTAMSTQSTTRERLQEEVREIWPELRVDNSPLAMALTSERADEFVSTVRALPAYKALDAAKERVKKFSDERLELAREEARLRRLLNTCRTVAMAANLPRIAPEVVSHYEQLVALEEGSLVSHTGSVAVSQSASTAAENSREK